MAKKKPARTHKTVKVPDTVLDLYSARIKQTGRSMHAELLTAIRRHVGLE